MSACLFLFVCFFFSLVFTFFILFYLLLGIYHAFLNLSTDFSIVFISVFLKSFKKQPFFSRFLLWSDVCCRRSSFRLSFCYDVFVSDFFFPISFWDLIRDFYCYPEIRVVALFGFLQGRRKNSGFFFSPFLLLSILMFILAFGSSDNFSFYVIFLLRV